MFSMAPRRWTAEFTMIQNYIIVIFYVPKDHKKTSIEHKRFPPDSDNFDVLFFLIGYGRPS